MMFPPFCPSAGPTGGAGLAWPAGICSLICPVIFFAILPFLPLPVLQFHRRVTPENVDGHFQFATLGLDFFDHAAEIEKRTVVDLDGFADLKADLRLFVLFGGR